MFDSILTLHPLDFCHLSPFFPFSSSRSLSSGRTQVSRGSPQRRSYGLSTKELAAPDSDQQTIKTIPTILEAIANPKYGYPDPQTFPSSVDTSYFKFEVVYESKISNARVGRIHTPHGVIETPGFVPVATNGALKYVDIGTSAASVLDTQLIFANTYHLLIHPGSDEIASAGGIHRFCGYSRPMITDSGGFQVFSMSNTTSQDELKGKIARTSKSTGKVAPNLLKKVSETGALFRSYRDGKLIELTPQSSVKAQKKIGADIIIPLDILLPNAVSRKKLLESFHRTHRWEAASLREHLCNLNQQAMFAVIHGGTNVALRRLSLEYLSSLPFQGMAIGGSLGRNSQEMYSLLREICPHIPKRFPIHLLGIGDPPSITLGASLGIDTFDSAYPTKTGRHGQFFAESKDGGGGGSGSGEISGAPKIMEHIDITKPRYRDVHNKPPVEGCECPTCSKNSAAYVHHLFAMNEPIALTMGATHNIHFMMKMMKMIRKRILDGKL